MKNYILFLIFIPQLLIFNKTIQAQWVQTSGPPGGYVYDFAFLDTNVFSANAGILFKSTIHGTSWNTSGLAGKYLTAVEAAPDGSGGMNLFACATQDGVFLSTDSGTTWNAVNNGLGNLDIYCIAITSNGTGGSIIFVGTISGGVYRSVNNGTSWNLAGLSGVGVYDIAASDTVLAAATTNGIYLSVNNGTSWNLTAFSGTFTPSVTIANNPNGNIELFAATYGTGVYRSSDSGATWNPFNNGLIGMYPTDFVVKDTVVYMTLYGFGVYKTYLSGTVWTPLNSIINARTISMYENSSTSVFFIGTDDGTGVYRTLDGLNPNLFVNGMIGTNVTSVAAIYDGSGTSLLFSGYLGEGGKIMRSDNYGANWNYSNSYMNMYAIRTFPHNIAGTLIIAGGLDMGSRLSADSGATWNLSIMDALMSVAYKQTLSGGYDVFAATGSGVFHTSNSGSTWNLINNGLTNNNTRAVCISDTFIFAGTFAGVFIKSINGNSWTASNNGLNSLDVFSMAAQGNHIFTGTSSGVYHSDDYGATWTISTIGVTGAYIFELLFHGSTLLAATNWGVFYTSDYGTTWTPFNTGFLTPEVNDLAVIDSFLVAGTRLGVWIRPLSQVITGVDSENSASQTPGIEIFPNPFNNSTTVEITVMKEGTVRAEIYDIKGKIIRSLFNDNLSVGKIQFILDARSLPQGFFLLRVTSGSQSETRKMLRIE